MLKRGVEHASSRASHADLADTSRRQIADHPHLAVSRRRHFIAQPT